MLSSFIRFERRAALAALTCSISIGISTANAQTTITTSQTGTNNGFYYSLWKNNDSNTASMTLGAAGNYSTTWSMSGVSKSNFTAGKGWATGGRKKVGFSGTFTPGSNGYLAVYGWTNNPAIEYYIVESYGEWTPPGSDLTSLGTFNADSGTYNVYKKTVTNAPCATQSTNCTSFDQYWSVRTTKRSSGVVNTGTHFDKWAALGMPMGSTWLYMIVETEGYESNGSSNITVVDAGAVTGVSVARMGILQGSSAPLVYYVLPRNATNRNVTFRSSNTRVATISSKGTITGVAAGTATITVTTAEGGFTGSGTVTIRPRTL